MQFTVYEWIFSIHQSTDRYKYFFRVVFCAVWKKQPFEGELNSAVLYFSNIFWILWFSIFISMGFVIASSSIFCWPLMLIKSLITVPVFLFLQILVSWKLCTFFSLVSTDFPLSFTIWSESALLSAVFFYEKPLLIFCGNNFWLFSYFFFFFWGGGGGGQENLLIWLIKAFLTNELRS